MVQFNGKSFKISILLRQTGNPATFRFFRQIRLVFLKYTIELNLCHAFRGGLKSGLLRTFLTTKDTKGAQSSDPGQSSDLHVQAGYV